MVLEQLKDGAQRQLQVLDEGTRQLIFVLCLPLIDGVFATLLVTGAVSTFTDVVSVALTIFSGAGALAVLYSYSESRREAVSMVTKAVPALLVGALAVAAVAPIYEQLMYVGRLQIAAGLALVVIAGKLAEVDFADNFSVPAVILTGFALSIRNPGALAFDPSYMAPAALTAAVASATLYASTYLAGRDLSMRYIRRGSAVVLLLISASMFGLSVPSELGLAIFAGSVLASLA
jgi:hypothetical protein